VIDPIGDTLVARDELRAKITELGARISADYQGKDLVLVGVLKGAVFFLADLARTLTVPCAIDFMAVTSYGSSTDSSGVVHILIVEDIIDSGLTLSYLLKNLRSRKPASLEVCALLTKPERRRINLDCRYIGFEIPNVFAIGYGLDWDERYRTLDHVASVREEAMAELTRA
jgi:hypoxanthine phosphoribosyltransferase